MSLYNFFDQAPGRRTDNKNVANAIDKDFPLQFVSHRRVKNEQVAKKAIAVWPKVKTITDYWKELLKNKQPDSGKPGSNVSYDRLCASLNDPLIPLKLIFFHEVAVKLNNFLTMTNPFDFFFGRNIRSFIEMVYGEVH